MNINAYILANRTQEVPVPVPGEPVNCTITPPNPLVLPYRASNTALHADKDFTNTYAIYALSGYEYARQGYDCIPCNFGRDNITLKVESEEFWNGRHFIYTDMFLTTTTGSFTVDVSGLAQGQYVFEVDHWFGYNSFYTNVTYPDSVVQIVGSKGRVVKSGTHGIIEGYVESTSSTDYYGYDSSYKGRVVKARLRYAFDVASGDTTKTFAWGNNADISLGDLWTHIHIYPQDFSTGAHSDGVWANVLYDFFAKVYKRA